MRTHGVWTKRNLPAEVISKFRETLGPSVKPNADGCWIWPKAKTPQHYGVVSALNDNWGAHRVSYVLHKGTIPAGRLVCHSCDVPACVNPEHLHLGTDASNMREKGKRGRVVRGRRDPGPALTAVHARFFTEDVERIKDIAGETGYPWQVELRLLVRRALKGEIREVVMLKETK